MKIATKTGDDGSTGLFGGRRISKSSSVVDVLGCLDELQTFVGWCKVCAKEAKNESGAKIANHLYKIQDDLYRIMGEISGGGAAISEKDVAWMEELIEEYERTAGTLDKFVKPGENELSARSHIARTVCRRAERAFVKFMMNEESEAAKTSKNFRKIVLKYLNRLSDLLFLMS